MTIGGSSILSDPTVGSHIVYPYNDEQRVLEAVTFFVVSGLRKGEAAVLVMTPEHCQPVKDGIVAAGFNVAQLESAGRFVCLDAHGLLETFMVGDMPDKSLFFENVGVILDQASAAPDGTKRSLRIYGEMVNLLWTRNVAAAEKLEEFWNEILKGRSAVLLCSYMLEGKLNEFPNQLVECHSHLIA